MEIFIAWVAYIHLEQIIHLKKHERLCENNDYCSIEMPTKSNKILKYNHGEKSFIIYVDLEYLLLKQQSYQNNANKSYTWTKSYTWAMWLFIRFCLFTWFKRQQT